MGEPSRGASTTDTTDTTDTTEQPRRLRSPGDPDSWGIVRGYHDALGVWREPSSETIDAVLGSMGALGAAHPDEEPALVLSVRLDHELPPVPSGLLVLEDGTEIELSGRLPRDIPSGYHWLHPRDGGPTRSLIASPGRVGSCPDPGIWGWAAQLYAARSTASWGMGDLRDLRRLGEWSAKQGAGMALLNPLHAAAPTPRQEPSPYFASSRCFANPLYLCVEAIPGAAGVVDLERLAGAGRALNASRLIERDRVWATKSEALEAIFARFGTDAGFDRFCAERGAALRGFAVFSALAEMHGMGWQSWPSELRDPHSPAVEAFASSDTGGRRIRYHSWLQWHLDRQLEEASRSLGLVQDLAIGVDAGGADAWLWQDSFATGMHVGAPPDEFNTQGQDWGLPPFDPWKLRAGGYEPFVQTVRSGLRHCGGLRFDHVMGLFRLFWIPERLPAKEGVYVRYPYWDLLNILALEAERAGAYVVGEDLGTVEDHVRAELAGRGVLSYRLFWFEPGRPATWPVQALGAVTTHDLPTVAGVWTGSDLETQRRLGLQPNEEAAGALRRRLAEWTGSSEDASVPEVVEGAYASLAEAPCAVLTASLDDAAGVEQRPNMPGTTDQWPNWCLALPVPLEELETMELPAALARHLNRRSPSPDT